MSYPVGRSHVQRQVLLVLSLLMLGLQVWLCPLWGRADGLSLSRWLSVLACSVLGLVWAWRGWFTDPVGWLTWAPAEADPWLAQLATSDGDDTDSVGAVDVGLSGWWWSRDQGALAEPVDQVRVVLLFNGWLLLRVRLGGTAGRVWWVWLERRAQPTRWLALRRALLSHAR